MESRWTVSDAAAHCFWPIWALAKPMVLHRVFADDPVLPLMIWYGINPAVGADRAGAVQLLAQCQIPKVRQFIARRLAADPAPDGR